MNYLEKIVLYFLHTIFFHKLSDEDYLKIVFRLYTGYELNLKNPITFSEKIQWLKLNDRKPIYTVMVDKYAAKEYVKSVVGQEHIIPTLGVWDSFDSIDFTTLPTSFVLKCTHDSGSCIVVKNRNDIDLKTVRNSLKKSIQSNYYYIGREWPYKNVKPRIIAEPYLDDGTGQIKDYKLFCFNGNPIYCQVISDRATNEYIDFYDMDWNHQIFVGLNPSVENSKKDIPKPIFLDKMIEYSKKLSENTYFCRIDFYELESKLYFGEITFYPFAGFGKFRPDEWDKKIGDLISLPLKNIK